MCPACLGAIATVATTTATTAAVAVTALRALVRRRATSTDPVTETSTEESHESLQSHRRS
jgi:hypothetical protein